MSAVFGEFTITFLCDFLFYVDKQVKKLTMETDKKFNSSFKFYPIYFLVGLISLIILFSLYRYFQIFDGGYSMIQDDWGYFGDFFGGLVGTLVSLVAVVLVYLTYRLQKVELRETSKALNSQNEQLKIQQFENTFFKLLERKESLIRSLDYKGKNSFAALRSINKKFKRDNNQHGREEALKKFWLNRAILISLVNTFISTIEYLDNFKAESNSQELKKS